MVHSADCLRMQFSAHQAERAGNFTSPNPKVGASVFRRGKLLGSAFHRVFGGPHAESQLLAQLGREARGGELYVTLEPCSTWGKTPPCTEAIIQSGIRKVMIGSIDPNPKHQGKALHALRQAGIKVVVGAAKNRCDQLIEPFSKWIKHKMPFVTLKMAMSLDGKIATSKKNSHWISCMESRIYAHKIRSEADAIIVGKNTVISDNPSLTVRHAHQFRKPWRVILDTKAELSVHHQVFDDQAPTMIVCSERHIERALKKFAKRSVSVLSVVERRGRIDAQQFLQKLGKFGFSSVMIEGGGEVAANFIEQKLVDKVCFIYAPILIGGKSAPSAFGGMGFHEVKQALRLKRISWHPSGVDQIMEGYF